MRAERLLTQLGQRFPPFGEGERRDMRIGGQAATLLVRTAESVMANKPEDGLRLLVRAAKIPVQCAEVEEAKGLLHAFVVDAEEGRITANESTLAEARTVLEL